MQASNDNPAPSRTGIETARLLLRPFNADDFDDLYAEAMLALGLGSLGWHRIVGSCDTRNHASARLMERIGMRKEAHFIHGHFMKGEWVDEFIFAILDQEWQARFHRA